MTIRLLDVPQYDDVPQLGFSYDDEEGSIRWAYHNTTIKLLGLIPHYDDQTVGFTTIKLLGFTTV